EALVVLRHDRRSDRPAREDGFLQELRRGLGHLRAGPTDLPYFELAPPRRAPHRHDPAFRLDPVTGVERMEELDRLVRSEQALVSVVPHGKLGDEVADHLELLGPGHQVAAVVRVLAAKATPD